MAEDTIGEENKIVAFPHRNMRRRLEILLGGSDGGQLSPAQLNQHLKNLAVYSAENNWEFTTYFLEKAQESLEELDKQPLEGGSPWLK